MKILPSSQNLVTRTNGDKAVNVHVEASVFKVGDFGCNAL